MRSASQRLQFWTPQPQTDHLLACSQQGALGLGDLGPQQACFLMLLHLPYRWLPVAGKGVYIHLGLFHFRMVQRLQLLAGRPLWKPLLPSDALVLQAHVDSMLPKSQLHSPMPG